MPKKSLMLKVAVLALFFVLIGASCSLIKKPEPKPPKIPTGIQPTAPTSLSDQLARQSQIRKFNNQDELKEFLEENAGGVSSVWGGGIKGEIAKISRSAMPSAPMGDFGFEFAEDLKLGVATDGRGSTDYSTTNIQVEGVDEADIIKTDGKYIYAVSKNNLFIIDGYPANDAKILSKIVFKSRPQDIYINENSLIVYGQDSSFYTKDIAMKLPTRHRSSSYTFFKVFDISDKQNPTQVRDLDFEGSYTNSRLIGDYVYFITTTYNYYLDDDIIIPRIIEDGEVLSTDPADERCNCPSIYYFDIPYQRYNFTSIAAINVADNSQKINNDIYLLSSNQNMYVSPDNIYLVYTKYINEQVLVMEVLKEIIFPNLSQRDQDRINKINLVENFILSREEKMMKIGLILTRYMESLDDDEQEKLEDKLEKAMKKKYEDISKELEKTVIHKIAIDKGVLIYQNFGEVTGQVLNQFSMDEQGDYFRIATTKNRRWSQFSDDNQSYNNLYVLDKDLKQVGAVENLAEGERIYSVRFMQNRAYMVTFRQTDPLFVIDLKDPKNPKVLGELKILGFSNYLHPYDNDTLIGLGRDADERGRTKGVKLSLFDVSDVSNPEEIDNYIIGDRGASSIALNNHKAFLFSRDKNLLVIPVTRNSDVIMPLFEEEELDIEIQCIGDGCILPPPKRRKRFRGAMVFNVTKDGFELKGEINHDDGTDVNDWWRGYSFYDTTVQRSLYIDDVLYTFSNKFLKMNELDDLDLVKNLELEKKKGEDDDFEVIN